MGYSLTVRTRILLAVLVGSVGLSFKAPQADKITVKELTVVERDIEDIAHLLQVNKFVGSYRLEGKVARLSLRIDFYNKGEKSATSIGGVWLGSPEPRSRSGKYCLQIGDLDYLPLGGGKKGHSRVHLRFTEGNVSSWKSDDVPKSVFDFSQMSGGGSFEVRASDKGEVPVFYRFAKGGSTGGATPEEVIRNCANTDLLIAYFLFE